jgi:ABC-type glycerol-3-phosphate transport system substrate-binding protein
MAGHKADRWTSARRRIPAIAAVALLSGTLGGLLPGSAQAAGNVEHASCLGATASSVAPGTKDDVALFITELANLEGTNHGDLVSAFAQEHTGVCVTIPPIPPHP